MKSIIAMNKFDVLCAVPVKEMKANSITELDLSGKSLGTEGALVLATYMEDNWALAKLMFGDGVSKPITEEGSHHKVGDMVEYQGAQCTVLDTNPNNPSQYRVSLVGTLETSMTEADLSGLKLGASGAIIAAAFLPKW